MKERIGLCLLTKINNECYQLMALSIVTMSNSIKFYDYADALQWMQKRKLPDQWHVFDGVNTIQGMFTLAEVNAHYTASKHPSFQILNAATAQAPDAKWLNYSASKSTLPRTRWGNLALIAICLLAPIPITIIIGAYLYNKDRKLFKKLILYIALGWIAQILLIIYSVSQ